MYFDLSLSLLLIGERVRVQNYFVSLPHNSFLSLDHLLLSSSCRKSSLRTPNSLSFPTPENQINPSCVAPINGKPAFRYSYSCPAIRICWLVGLHSRNSSINHVNQKRNSPPALNLQHTFHHPPLLDSVDCFLKAPPTTLRSPHPSSPDLPILLKTP
jgi:hypothetical protein